MNLLFLVMSLGENEPRVNKRKNRVSNHDDINVLILPVNMTFPYF